MRGLREDPARPVVGDRGDALGERLEVVRVPDEERAELLGALTGAKV